MLWLGSPGRPGSVVSFSPAGGATADDRSGPGLARNRGEGYVRQRVCHSVRFASIWRAWISRCSA
jgi:hypothetical protein